MLNVLPLWEELHDQSDPRPGRHHRARRRRCRNHVFRYDYGFLVQPNGDRCYSSASGFYYKHMEEF